MLLALLRSAAEHSRSAVTIGDRRITFDELLERTLRLATGLSDIGVSQSSCVAVVVPNGLEYVVSVLAINAIGAIALPLNPAYEREELTHYLGRANVAALICSNGNVGKSREVVRQLGMTSRVIALSKGTEADYDLPTLIEARVASRLPVVAQDDVVLFLHTSGTTGRPKLVPRTAAQLSAASAILCRALHTGAEDTILCTVPLFHGQGFTNCLVAALYAGASLVVPEGLLLARDLGRLLQIVERERVTIWPSVPIVFDLLARSAHAADLSALRLCLSGGTSLPREVFDRFGARFGVPIRQFYGCSEAGVVSMNLDDEVGTSAHTVGRPFTGVQIPG